jgi:hypothetical protein
MYIYYPLLRGEGVLERILGILVIRIHRLRWRCDAAGDAAGAGAAVAAGSRRQLALSLLAHDT